MSIPDGATGTVINGTEQKVTFKKVGADDKRETYALDPDAPPMPVDTPQVAADTGTWAEQRRADLTDAPAVLPTWLRSVREFAVNMRWTLAYCVHFGAFHLLRLPVYLIRLLLCAPRGTGRLIVRWGKWVADTEARPVTARAAATADIEAWLALSREHSRRVRPRRIASLALAGAVLLILFVAALAVPLWCGGAVTAALALAGVHGRRGDKPIVTRYLSIHLQRPLDSEELAQAIEAIGVKGTPRFVAPIAVDGPGWLAQVDLPGATLAELLLDKRKELAAAMRRPLQCVWPSVGSEHPGRANIWVAKKDPRTILRPWPLLAGGAADMYGEIPFGVTPKGDREPLAVIATNMLIGGVMGSGKTSAVCTIACAGALDPTCEEWLFELKGSGDLEGLRPICHRYVQGDDDEHCEAALDGGYALEREMKRRKKTVAGLPVADVPTGRKVTRKLSDKYPHLHLHPILAIFDEVHTLFEHPVYGKEAEAVFARLIRKARAYGIILVLTTQRPDAKSIPKKISDNAIVRFCLAITGHTANDLVLGTGMYKRGIRANIFEPAEGDDPKDSGTGWLARSATNAKIVRAYFIPQADVRDVGRRGLALRTAAGTLSGEAAGQQIEKPDRTTIADHVHAIWPDGADAVHSHRLVESLALYLPELYGSWMETEKPVAEMSPDEVRDVQAVRSTALSAALKVHKIPTRQITIRDCCGGAKGVRYADLPEPRGADEDDEDPASAGV
ncbi:FtsK/SpoIIIE domain-containing protein [Streptomyces sp. NRRL S-920]|uniref:FtsK/SpoIIIE domain-containing protein n=1 Tax=Streptomyces sp. NRRL S-920 TaxID=1463921 RepID=UPI0006906E24|nr:FtsK/SpoIIIE domain-containing protein [Streptomyces sp. NRRL S-920]